MFDLWTIEYIDVFTKDGHISGSSKTLAEIKTKITELAPNFAVADLVKA